MKLGTRRVLLWLPRACLCCCGLRIPSTRNIGSTCLHAPPLVLSAPRHGLLLLAQVDAEARVGADGVALPDEQEGDDAHEGAQAAEEAARAGDAEAVEHGHGGEREDDGEEAAGHGGGGVGGRGVHLVGVGEVVEQGHEDEHEAGAEGQAGQHGDDEVDVLAGGEAEPEEADDEERAAQAGEREPAELFLAGEGGEARVGLGAADEGVPGEDEGQGEEGAAADGEEGEAGFAGAEAVEGVKDDGEGLEGHVEDGVDEGEVGADAGDDELGQDHAQGPGEDDGGQAVEVGRGFEFPRGHEVAVAFRVGFAERLGAADEEDGAERLGDDEDEKSEGGAGVDEGHPKGPAPAYGHRAVP